MTKYIEFKKNNAPFYFDLFNEVETAEKFIGCEWHTPCHYNSCSRGFCVCVVDVVGVTPHEGAFGKAL